MEKSTHELKWFHFLASWFLCLLTGLGVQVVFSFVFLGGFESFGLALLTAVIALGVSSPFIILFCLVVHFGILNKPRTASEIHTRVFLWHVIGSLMIFVGLVVFFNSEMKSGAGFVVLIMLGYFTVDSIYFHSFIHRKTKKTNVNGNSNTDILDDF